MAPHADDSPSTARAAPPPRVGRVGQRVGPFLLTERIALAEVIGLYRASRPAGSRQPREVAIRIVEDARDDRAAAWVRHEYDILRRLDHPAIPRAHGYYSSQVGVAISLPPQIRLDQVLAARRAGRVPLEPATALDIVCEVADALRHAHAIQGPDGPICHGHLTPASIGLHRDGTVAVLGFGAAPMPLPVGYRPPEQVAGAFVDARSDQWRLGALTVELLLGTSLYADLDDPVAAAAEGAVAPWVARIERRHPEVARVVAKLLSPAAGSRYDHDNTLVRDLLEAVRRTGGRPDRRALVSRMRAVQDAEARRAAEAARAAQAARAAEPEVPPAPPLQQPEEREFRPTPELPDTLLSPRPPAEPVASGPPPVRAWPEKQATLDQASGSPSPSPGPATDAPHGEHVPPRSPAALRPPLPQEPPEAALAIDAPAVIPDPSEVTRARLDGPGVPEVVVESEYDPDSVDPFDDGLPASPPVHLHVGEIDPFADPASVPGPVAVAFEDDIDDDPSLGLDRLSAHTDEGPALGPMRAPVGADDPASGWDPSPDVAADPSTEVTEVIGPGHLSPGTPPPVPVGPRPARWFPSELAAMAAIGVALIVAILFMAWRFG